jgi:hypothetical protein
MREKTKSQEASEKVIKHKAKMRAKTMLPYEDEEDDMDEERAIKRRKRRAVLLEVYGDGGGEE